MDNNLLPAEERVELFSELNCLKVSIWLMQPWSKCSCLTQWLKTDMYLFYIFADSFTTDIPFTCCLYSHPWHGQSGCQADKKLVPHCHRGIAHRCRGIWHLVTLPGDFMLLFNAMPMSWVMAWTTKLRQYTHVHNTNGLLEMKKYALSLNLQMSTNI